ncbi:hypothetical protein CRG98_046867 [Punica granatum]|uniref:Uncharacterized protein n=1 Tax=Punica granatum TaxID=22663 RepID=A0A2I0HLY9_PUNGR|nr:hypothetical protein CRG98_046867 [Punica granatum]
MLGQGPKTVNAESEPDAWPEPNAVHAGPEPDAVNAINAGPEPDAGLEPNAVNAGPEPDAGPEPNAVNTGSEPDVEPEPDVVNPGPELDAVNTGPEPNAVNERPEPGAVNAGPEPNAVNAGPEPDAGLEPDAESARNAKAKVNAEEQRGALQSGDSDLLAIFVERGWELSVEIPRSWMRDVCYFNCGPSVFRLPSCWGFPAMGNGKTMKEQKLFTVLTQRGGNRTRLVGVMREWEGICTGVSGA